jgi:beta-lactamase class A
MHIRRSLLATLTVASLFFFSHSHANEFTTLESKTGTQIGLYALNTSNGEVVEYQSDERFSTGSTFKVILASAILKKSETNPELMNKTFQIKKEDISSWAPVTEKKVGQSMSVQALLAVMMTHSDNTAAELLTRELGGAQSVVEYARSIGDTTFSIVEGSYTTTASAMNATLQKILLGDVLQQAQRDQLKQWMVDNTTGNLRIRAGVPKGWLVADKTGSSQQGHKNDIGVIWPRQCKPIVISVFTLPGKQATQNQVEAIAQSTKNVIGKFAKTDACLSQAM